MKSLTLRSPAKLNLYLKVLNKRPDGFHNIETLFERINLVDDIHFRANTTGRIRITCNHPQVPTGTKNLVHKVAKKLQEDYQVTKGADIHIHKRIPVAAGLAGGSSNAATALTGLNRLWRLGLRRPQLLSYARRLGSDIGFFLYDHSWAVGRDKGDHIDIYNINRKLWHFIVVPRIKIYSWKVYGGLKLQLTKPKDNVNILIHNLKKRSLSEVSRLLSNDLEPPIIKLCPRLKKVKERLSKLVHSRVMISGSGPSIYAITESEKEARTVSSMFDKRFTQIFVVRTL